MTGRRGGDGTDRHARRHPFGDRRRRSRRVRAACAAALAVALAATGAAAAWASPRAAAPAAPAAPAETSGGATAIPAPGSASAHPETGIVLRALPPGGAAGPAVSGSVSGPHPMSLTPHPDGAGLTVDPDTAFVPGETVTVTGTGPILSGGQDGYSFEVATPAQHPGILLEDGGAPAGAPPDLAELAAAATTDLDLVQPVDPNSPYVSRPDLAPPGITVSGNQGATAPGLLFATPNRTERSQNGVMVFDNAGDVVWFRPVPGLVAGDAKVQTLNGEPVLAWFEGSTPYGPGNYRGEWLLVDDTYEQVGTVRMGNGYQADIHDFRITPQNTALLMAYSPVVCDGATLRGCSVGATVLDAVVQELDIATGAVLFEWHALDHLPLTDSYFDLAVPLLDYFHINSVDLDTDGDVLISARHTSALYKVDRVTGEVLWIFGGKRNEFSYVGDPTAIQGPDFPHDFRARTPGVYSYFDNSNRRAAADPTQMSRAAIVALSPATDTATYSTILQRTPPIFGPTQGRMQGLPDGHNLVTWGGLGIATEFDGGNATLFEARLATATYRMARQEWTGAPSAAPDVAVASRTGGQVRLAVSWNGDTRTAAWRLLSGASAGALTPVGGSTPRTGFETQIQTSAAGAFFAVQALNAAGNPIPGGRSDVVRGRSYFAERASAAIGGTYRPLVGDFGGGRNDDVLYYSSTGPDYLHVSDGAGGFTSHPVTVGGGYDPLIGDFVGDTRDEVLWRTPGKTTAYLWRFDGVPRSAAPGWQSASFTVPATVTRALVLDHRPDYGGGYDEVFFYATGPNPDRIDRYGWRAGQPLEVASRGVTVSGTYRPIVGDYDGNGLADILWYGAGAVPDSIWQLIGGPSGSTGYTTVPARITGSYSVLAGNFAGPANQDEVLFDARGPAVDHLWNVTPAGIVSVRVTSESAATPRVLNGLQDAVLLWSSGSPAVWRFDGIAPTVEPSGNAALGTGYQPIVGDFVGAGGGSSVLWYAPGAAPERLYVG